jgi:glyoxylase-like metal-dependent hydrolase (beta-lactamase superfamily II)
MLAKKEDAAQRAELAILDFGKQLAPTDVIAKSGEREMAGKALTVTLEANAVTAGDLWIFDPATNVVIAGDLVTLPAPFLDTACPSGWQRSLDDLAKADFDLLIPGHGAPMTHKQFDVYRASFTKLLACAASKSAQEECVNGWITGVAGLQRDADDAFARAVTAYYVDVLRGDPARVAKLCA